MLLHALARADRRALRQRLAKERHELPDAAASQPVQMGNRRRPRHFKTAFNKRAHLERWKKPKLDSSMAETSGTQADPLFWNTRIPKIFICGREPSPPRRERVFERARGPGAPPQRHDQPDLNWRDFARGPFFFQPGARLAGALGGGRRAAMGPEINLL